MSQSSTTTPLPARPGTRTPGTTTPGTTAVPARTLPSIGTVPFALMLLSALLVLLPWTRAAGLTLVVLLLVPAVVVRYRARRSTDGSRGLTTATLAIGFGAIMLGGALAPPPATTPAGTPAQVTAPPAAPAPADAPGPVTAVAPAPAPAVQDDTPAPQVQQQPFVPAPAPRSGQVPPAHTPDPAPAVVHTPPAHTPDPAPVPAPEPAADEPPASGAAYYQNCTQARAAGAAPIRRGEPGYRAALDRDDDGVACE